MTVDLLLQHHQNCSLSPAVCTFICCSTVPAPTTQPASPATKTTVIPPPVIRGSFILLSQLSPTDLRDHYIESGNSSRLVQWMCVSISCCCRSFRFCQLIQALSDDRILPAGARSMKRMSVTFEAAIFLKKIRSNLTI